MLVLTSLASGPKHGYTLIKDVEGFAAVRLGPGTLYAALAKLERQGLVRPLAAEGRRHPYEITPVGLETLRRHLVDSSRIAEVGLARIKEAMT